MLDQLLSCSSWRRVIHQTPSYIRCTTWKYVLSPLLCIYINNIVTVIIPGNEINIFADIVLYLIITSPNDSALILLQEDIFAISSFLDNKHLNFNEDKCCTMLISRKRSNSLSPPPLYLNATELVQVTSYKYLWLIITNTLPLQTLTCKKLKQVDQLEWCTETSTNTPAPTYCWNYTWHIIRPHLEYLSPEWNPFNKVRNWRYQKWTKVFT